MCRWNRPLHVGQWGSPLPMRAFGRCLRETPQEQQEQRPSSSVCGHARALVGTLLTVSVDYSFPKELNTMESFP